MKEDSKYAALVRYALERMDEGAWKPGTKLPSVREMAAQRGCSVNSVLRAYEYLRDEGYLYAKPKAGFYVATSGGDAAERRDADVVDWMSASPDASAMPYREFQAAMNKAIFLHKGALFDYGDPQGLPSLRRAISRQLKELGWFADESRVFVTSGAQQALQLLAAMPFPNGKTQVLVEQPAYHGMLRALRLMNVPAIGIERTRDGVDLDELERHFRSNQIKFFYTTSRYHNPTGWCYSKSQRESIARLARKHDVYILEDDYLADLAAPGAKQAPIVASDGSERVIYVKSFSKTMLPDLRLGAAVLPTALAGTFRAYKSASDLSSSTLSQNALELFIENGIYARHAEAMRGLYRARMDALVRLCREALPDAFAIDAPAGGIFAALRLPASLPETELVRALREAGVLALHGEPFYLPDFPRPQLLRLSVIRADEAALRTGVERLAAAALRLLRTTPRERAALRNELWL
ncbi:PLP-dependent aminotransferase family protein [Paenibacillus sp.]|uniref:aminotransferase-like domain-containing protein n=1 Tax=Paenibacillus sp. TaxID=58172 RepID=UPI002D53DB43|nr:PLP-dependent aminotransferase family protein [Paenibacillus sp.]HZG85181.1 PLP-dependent aminotransferase family protein [Paenibacillus sp.]